MMKIQCGWMTFSAITGMPMLVLIDLVTYFIATLIRSTDYPRTIFNIRKLIPFFRKFRIAHFATTIPLCRINILANSTNALKAIRHSCMFIEFLFKLRFAALAASFKFRLWHKTI